MPTKTAAQARQQAKDQYDAYLATCPSRLLLDRISNKWVTLIITALRGGPLRYSQLRTTIAGVSEKMLTQTLRSLERDGLISRTVTPSVPVRVDYALTPLGVSILEPITIMKEWAEQHMPAVTAARQAHDVREAS
ncbi:HxlR family transcriptional regulator [Janibacter sp. Soil728]|uniref:winged helix-turn-helix transcriptional regulator n=1 Tax=Janibacter sp. Soil728 TaxID=1736393 RepID=UPI0006FC6AB8|nr:helix-turn-helix domain-containing protein [Janibacter sp. Soil728]KRE37904.1 HxlR family transcriptional regulator [Janibacter sp. Soil728]